MKIEMKSLPAIRVAGLRHVGPYSEISEAFARLCEVPGFGDLVKDDSIMLAVYHDDPSSTPAESLRSDAAFSVTSSAQIPPGLSEQVLPGGRYACTVHKGPYATLPDAWTEMKGAVPGTGADFAEGPSLEIYLNDPTTTASEELLTEIRIPVTAR